MNIIPFDRQIEPQVVKSPFLRGIKGPGFFAEARQEFAEDYEDEEEYEKVKKPIGTGRKGRPAGPVPIPSPSTFPAMASPSPGLIPSPGQAPHYPTVPGPQAPGPVYPIASPASLPHSQPPMTARPTYTPTPSNPAYRATPPHPGQGYTPRSGPPVTPGSAAGPSTASPHPHPHAAHPSASASISSRSITAAMGGAGMSDQIAVKEYLPLDIGEWGVSLLCAADYTIPILCMACPAKSWLSQYNQLSMLLHINSVSQFPRLLPPTDDGRSSQSAYLSATPVIKSYGFPAPHSPRVPSTSRPNHPIQ